MDSSSSDFAAETLDAPAVPSRPVTPLETEHAIAPGTIIGRYETETLLGEGAQGCVYRAKHVELGTPVAIKVAWPDLGGSGVRRLRFEREALLGAQIRHRNVVSVLDVGELEAVPYLVMELVEGDSLADALARTTLSPAATVEIGLQLLAAVHALADQDIVHRDIKPDNIVLHRAIDGDVVVKLLDFGISKTPRPELAATITQDGTVIGTPHYMSPEQLRGEDADVRSDMYAVCAVLYECLAGHPPHDGDTLATVFASALHDAVAPLRTLAPGCPRELADVIHHGLKRDADDRPDHPSILAERLRGVAQRLGLARGADAWGGLLEDPRGVVGTSAFQLKVKRTRPRGWRRYASRARSRFLAAAALAVAVTVGTTAALSMDGTGEAALAQLPKDEGVAATPRDDAPPTDEASIEELERGARSLFLRGESASALALYRQAVRREPDRGRAWRDLGIVAQDLDDGPTARRAFQRYLSLEPQAQDADQIRGRLSRLGDG